jgi:penicillin-binding protein 2
MLVIDQLRKGDRPLQVLSCGILLGLGVLLAGLWHVQIVSAKKYQNSQVNQSVRTVRQPSIRGKIKDRHGELLADNRANYVVNMYLDGLRKKFSEEYGRLKTNYLAAHPGVKLVRTNIAPLQRTSRFLAASNSLYQLYAVLETPAPIDAELEKRFTKHYEQKRSYPLLVRNQLTPGQIARFMEQGKRIPGVDLEIQPLRYYPHGELAAHVLGHLGRDVDEADEGEEEFDYRVPDYVGRVGIERAFDDVLKGSPGVKSIVINNALYRHEEQVIAEPLPGHDVCLTLDLGLQEQVEKAMRPFGPDTRGSAIVMDVRNGDILAMVSTPAYDPNVWLNQISSNAYVRLSDEKLDPQMNRSTSGAYAPGSIFKIITGLVALEAGVVTPTNIYTKAGSYKIGRRAIKDLAPDGDMDFRKAFIKSSNGYFIHYGLAAGAEKVLAMGHQFCLGEKTGLPLTLESRGDFPEYKDKLGVWSQGNFANVCIGQEITVTPIQMAVMVSAVANGGTVFWPRIIDRIEPPEHVVGESVTNFPAGQVRRQIKLRPENWATMRFAMREDVRDPGGTGHAANISEMTVCGKTGTAQITDDGQQVDKTTWFASFAPYEEPRYAVIVMIESVGGGGTTCAPIAGKIYQALQKRDPTLAPPKRAAIAARN